MLYLYHGTTAKPLFGSFEGPNFNVTNKVWVITHNIVGIVEIHVYIMNIDQGSARGAVCSTLTGLFGAVVHFGHADVNQIVKRLAPIGH